MSVISSYSIQNAGTRQIYKPSTQAVEDNLDEIARRDGKSKEADLSEEARFRVAEEVLKNIDFYA